jgi:hypothetical protein
MAQAVSCLSLTAEAGFAPESVHVQFVTDKFSIVQVFLRDLCSLPCQYHSTMVLHTHISSRPAIQNIPTSILTVTINFKVKDNKRTLNIMTTNHLSTSGQPTSVKITAVGYKRHTCRRKNLKSKSQSCAVSDEGNTQHNISIISNCMTGIQHFTETDPVSKKSIPNCSRQTDGRNRAR